MFSFALRLEGLLGFARFVLFWFLVVVVFVVCYYCLVVLDFCICVCCFGALFIRRLLCCGFVLLGWCFNV